jgi:ABC-2 type transport system ATP-binding protein
MEPARHSIIARHLGKRYGHTTALDGLSFAVRKGEVVGFLGPNGAGKSTTLRILSGLLPATTGAAWVEGVPVAWFPHKVKPLVGYMPENNPLPEDLRVVEYLRWRGRLKGLSGRLLTSRVDEVLEICDLAHKARRKVIGALSKGFRQRVGIADAILAQPPVTILDEPTIGLDPHQIIMIRDLIQHLRGRTTVILSSHILSEVEMLCDRVLILNHGRLVAAGTRDELRAEFMPGSCYQLEVAAERAVVEAALADLPGEWRVRRCEEPAADGYRRVRVATPDSTHRAAELLAHLQPHPTLRLRGLQRINPSLEEIFLAATQRSWELGHEELAKP